MSLMWMKALDIGKTFHPERSGVMRLKSKARGSLWHSTFRMLKNTSIRDVRQKL